MVLGPLGSLAASARATLARHEAPHPVPTRPATVFVLSGGAALGAAQAGMLRVLLDAGVVPDAVVGVSAGAINGAHVAQKPHGLLSKRFVIIRDQNILPVSDAQSFRSL